MFAGIFCPINILVGDIKLLLRYNAIVCLNEGNSFQIIFSATLPNLSFRSIKRHILSPINYK